MSDLCVAVCVYVCVCVCVGGCVFVVPLGLPHTSRCATAQYLVDYSIAGSLVRDLSAADTFMQDAIAAGKATKRFTPPDHLDSSARWGRNQGCAFLTDGVAQREAQYRCTAMQQGASGCSYDARFVSVQ